jgi:hypothetical protein
VYEFHVRALRDIYSSEPEMRLRSTIRLESQLKSRANNFARSKQFQSSGKARSTESRKKIERENIRMAEKLYTIQHGGSVSKADLQGSESLRKLQARNLINRKKIEYDSLNKDNLKIHSRLTNQYYFLSRKGQISFAKLEHEFAKNREHIDRITKYRVEDDKVLLSGCLVAQDGRFRVPGSKYTSISSLKPSSRKSKRGAEDSRLSAYSTPRSVRSKQSSRASQRKPLTQNAPRDSTRSISKPKFRHTGADLFEQKKAPELHLKLDGKTKGFMLKKNTIHASAKLKSRPEPSSGSRQGSRQSQSRAKSKGLSRTAVGFQ